MLQGIANAFPPANPNGTRAEKIFKHQAVGKNYCMGIVKYVFQAEGVCGDGVKYWVTTHGIIGTLETLPY